MFERGTVILVPFPFTDLSAKKVRPAIIVSHPDLMHGDAIVVFVSSVLPIRASKTEVVIQESDPEFIKMGLKRSSVVKCHKVATLDQRIILGELGKVPTSMQKKIDRGIAFALGLT